MDWGGLDLIFSNAEEDEAGAAGVPSTSAAGKENVNVDTVDSDCGPAKTSADGMDSHGNDSTPASVGERQQTANKLRCKIYRQRKKIKKLEAQLNNKHKATLDDALTFSKQVLPPNIYSFLKLQLRCAGVKPKGRRYSDSEMMMALALHYQGARAYRHLRSIFFLPHPRQLRKRIEHIQMLPGFQDVVIGLLGENLKNMPDADRRVVLSMDEMMVRKKLVHHRGEDYVEGFQDLEELGRTTRVADHLSN